MQRAAGLYVVRYAALSMSPDVPPLPQAALMVTVMHAGAPAVFVKLNVL